MQVYGSSVNLGSFTRYGLKMLEDAGIDYMKALSGVEIFLGEIFVSEAKEATLNQIFDTRIDKYRSMLGEKGVKTHIYSYLGHELGHIVQKKYISGGSPKWQEIERMLGQKLDFSEYYCKISKKKYCPAEEIAADLFDHALLGYREIIIKKVSKTSQRYIKELGEDVVVSDKYNKTKIEFNPHLWRKWFFDLWEQEYEWGCFKIDEKLAIANGQIYFFDLIPRVIDKQSFIPPKSLLEAHGFKVKFSDNRVEYWR